MKIDDLLGRLDGKLREQLHDALTHRRLDGRHSFTVKQIAEACADDGWIVTQHSIRMWRERNGNR